MFIGQVGGGVSMERKQTSGSILKHFQLLQVEPEGDFLVESNCILERREISLRNHTIGQVKVQWKHLSQEEAGLGIGKSYAGCISNSVPGEF